MSNVLAPSTLVVVAMVGCSNPNPAYIGDYGAADRSSLDLFGDMSGSRELGPDGRRDAALVDGPRADRRRDGRPVDARRADTRPADARPPDARPPDARPPDTQIQLPDGPTVVTCAALEPVASGTLGEPGSAHIALDSVGNPHVVYIQGTELRHALRSGGVWSSDLVAQPQEPASVRVAVFKPNANLEHIEVVYDAVASAPTRRVFHRWRSAAASAWSAAANVDTNVDVDGVNLAAASTLRIAANGGLSIGPGLFNGHRVWQPSWSSGGYSYPTSYTVNSGTTQVYHARVGVGPTHVASTAFLGGAAPAWQIRREAVGSGGGSTVSIPASGFIQAPAAVTVASTGGVHLAYAGQNSPQPANAGIYYAFWSGGAAPQQQSLGGATYARLAVDIDLDGWEQPHIVFVEVGTNGGAKWIRRQGTTWSQAVSIVSGGVVGVRLAVDGAKRVAHFVLESYAGGQYAVSYRSCAF